MTNKEAAPVNPEVLKGIPHHIKEVPIASGLGGAYGSWGVHVENADLPLFIEGVANRELAGPDSNTELVSPDKMHHDYGFYSRYSLPSADMNLHQEVEVAYGAEMVKAAVHASSFNGVDAVVIASSMPVVPNFAERVAEKAGFKNAAVIGNVHVACAGGAWGLARILNEKELQGKRVILGGFEGLGRYATETNVDDTAAQLFGNGAGFIGFIPGETLHLIAEERWAKGDERNAMSFAMTYPCNVDEGQLLAHSGSVRDGSFTVAGKMPNPPRNLKVSINNTRDMIRLFIPDGSKQIARVVEQAGRAPNTSVIHHMNKRIMQMYNRRNKKNGTPVKFEWLFEEYGNVSAASSIIAYLRNNPNPNEVTLMHGLGVGGYFATVMFAS